MFSLTENNLQNRRIIFFDHDAELTGSTISLTYLLKAFKAKSFDILVVTPKSLGNSKIYTDLGVSVYPIKKSYHLDISSSNHHKIYSPKGLYVCAQYFINIFKASIISLKIRKKFKPSIIYINEYVSINFAIIFRMLKIPVLCHVRSQIIAGTIGFRRYLVLSLIYRVSNKIFAITSHEADQFERFKNKKNYKVKIINDFLDEDDFEMRYDDSIKNEFSIPADKPVLLMLGGLSSIKGALPLLQALPALIADKINFVLVIVGPINFSSKKLNIYRDICLDFISTSGLKDYVMILDSNTKIKSLISICDVLISSNTTSHFSRPVIEAWAQKKAVISSGTEHAIDYITNEHDGLLFDIKDPDLISNTIKKIIQDDKLRHRIGTTGYMKAKTQFNSAINIANILDVCEDILNY